MTETLVRTIAPEVRWVAGYELRGTETEGRFLTAVVTTFGDWKDVGPFEERMMPGVFDVTLARSADSVKLLVEHQHRNLAVATPVEWAKSDSELAATFQFGSHEEARAAHRAAEEKLWGGVSVGFLPGRNAGDSEWSPDGKRVTRHQARLLEVSLTSVPANADARILAVRTAGVPQELVRAATPWLDEYRKKYPRSS